MKKSFTLLTMILFTVLSLNAQEDLLEMLNSDEPETEIVTATFKSTRVMNGHSVASMAPGQLDFRISHRFGRINSGAYEFFGLDQANIHLSLEYGITDWLMLGVGRGTYEKTFDGFAKFTLLRQSKGARQVPLTLSFVSSVAATSLKWTDPERPNYFSSRLSYVNQLIAGRKFSPAFSFQLVPTYVHRNLVETETDPNDILALGAGGRIKLTKRISLNGEYYYLANPGNYQGQPVRNPLSAGFDIETGGHVFQLIFTNSLAMIEKGFIGETTGKWSAGDVHFGFNISRVFTLGKHRPEKPW